LIFRIFLSIILSIAGWGKREFKKMSKSERSRQFQIFLKEFKKESDRACVILSAAMLDQSLAELLKKYLVPIATSKDTFIEEPSGPIYSFSARIDLAHRVGLITTRFCRDLHKIRDIRNDFAHDVTGCSFKNPSVCDKVNAIVHSQEFVKKYPYRGTLPEGTRGDFQLIVSWMLWRLGNVPESVETLKSPLEEFGYVKKVGEEIE
jgi:hypothetical protein